MVTSMNEPFLKDHLYHIYNRGCNKENIFFNEENYIYLLRKIKNSYIKYGATLIAYCLMPNHYHFLVRQVMDRPLSEWIQVLFNGYVQAVNKQQGRSGTLFQGKARHILVDDNSYLVHRARYIHFNPVEAGLVSRPEDWHFSNYAEWIGLRKGTLVDHKFLKDYFPEPLDYRKFVEDYRLEKRQAKKLQKYFLD